MFQQVMALQNSPTYRRTLAERLERERMAKNNGTVPGGLASMIDAGTAAYLRMRDEGDRSKAQEALVGGLTKGGEWGTADGQQPNAPRMEPGIGAAKHNLAQLDDNPYAGRLTQMLAFEEMARQQEAAARQQQFQQQLYRDQLNNEARMRAAAEGRSSVNVNTGNSGPQFGNIPTGYMMRQTEEGNWEQIPVPGGPAAREIEAAGEAKDSKVEGERRKTSLVLEDIGRFREKIKNAPWFSPVTGIGGMLLSAIPGSGAYDAGRVADTIRANIGFDRLQQMRDESPTGGALGAVNNQEMNLLQSVLGSLDQAQSDDQLLYNLERLEGIYRQIERKLSAYPNASQYGFGQGGDIGNGIRAMPNEGGGQSGGARTRFRYDPETDTLEPVR